MNPTLTELKVLRLLRQYPDVGYLALSRARQMDMSSELYQALRELESELFTRNHAAKFKEILS